MLQSRDGITSLKKMKQTCLALAILQSPLALHYVHQMDSDVCSEAGSKRCAPAAAAQVRAVRRRDVWRSWTPRRQCQYARRESSEIRGCESCRVSGRAAPPEAPCRWQSGGVVVERLTHSAALERCASGPLRGCMPPAGKVGQGPVSRRMGRRVLRMLRIFCCT